MKKQGYAPNYITDVVACTCSFFTHHGIPLVRLRYKHIKEDYEANGVPMKVDTPRKILRGITVKADSVLLEMKVLGL